MRKYDREKIMKESYGIVKRTNDSRGGRQGLSIKMFKSGGILEADPPGQ